MASAKEHLEILRDEVRQVQERLRAAGENPGPSDGAPGAQTVAALRQYQRTHGLPITGLLDEATQRALGFSAALPPATTTGGDTVPRFTRQNSPEYPPAARQQGLEGTVTLHLELLADGTVGEVKVAQSSGHALLDTAAQETARTWTHSPAMHNGTAVTRWVKLSLTFSLDKAAPESKERKKTRR
jgi:protein TonB